MLAVFFAILFLLLETNKKEGQKTHKERTRREQVEKKLSTFEHGNESKLDRWPELTPPTFVTKDERERSRRKDAYRAKPLLTENEKKWYKAIKEAAPNAHVFAQVALNQLVRAEGSSSAWYSAHNKINARSLDFVVLNNDMNAILAIEIDDRSHLKAKRQADDEKKNNALQQAGIPLLRIPATPVLTGDQVKLKIVDKIAKHKAASTQSA